MENWNVGVTTCEEGFGRARDILKNFGEVSRTPYFNVLVLRVEAIRDFLEALKARVDQDQRSWRVFPRPAREETFDFQSPDEFEARAKAAVRNGCRNFREVLPRAHAPARIQGRLSSHEEERRLAEFALERLSKAAARRESAFTTRISSWKW
jgi:hypothetical protein